ncbi:hypothetical protein XELAEV_18034997mg [Xenopus laevis]|uniref:Uncharacterized protein n=1 Tax=Xenopus laevis TaxID=8355 RepID=A0A974CG61_XENLA|nr:hypothetical protein XELAEV_18034997mg [Xenopus laevis]
MMYLLFCLWRIPGGGKGWGFVVLYVVYVCLNPFHLPRWNQLQLTTKVMGEVGDLLPLECISFLVYVNGSTT